MSMYPDESIKDSPAEKRRKIYARLFWVFVVATLVLAAAALYANFYSLSLRGEGETSEPIANANPDASPSASAASSSAIDNCNAVVATMPGDLEIALNWGWEIECVESGDPELFDQGDFYTLGYADPKNKRIAIAAPDVTARTIAHEAAHVIDFEQLSQSDIDAMAAKYGADDWYEGTDYFNVPAEMFAEGRSRCLGFGADLDFAVMDCEDIDSLIALAVKSDQIIEMANPNS